MKIGRFDLCSNDEFELTEIKSTDSPYWRVENGQIFYIVWDVIRTKYIERKKIKMCMSKEEATQNNYGCYYKILESEV